VLEAERNGVIDAPVVRNLDRTGDFIDGKGRIVDEYGPVAIEFEADVKALLGKLEEHDYQVLFNDTGLKPEYAQRIIDEVKARLKNPSDITKVISVSKGRLSP
jgi:hypothetical protein